MAFNKIETEKDSYSVEVKKEDKDKSKTNFSSFFLPFYSFTDLSNNTNFMLLVIFRLFLAVYGTKNNIYPDEYW